MRDILARPERSLGAHGAARKRSNTRNHLRKINFGIVYALAGAVGLFAIAPWSMTAHADGETRSLSLLHTHRQDSITVTFRRNGQYDEQALDQLNWFLRDWRNDKPAKMDPRLFDILWEIYRKSGSGQPINIISSYRSPETNAGLRRRSSGVAEHSQHMLGKAMDIRLPDISSARLRAIAMHMQYGGVGYYASSNFVHVDTGSVRAWPRMTQQQLVRLFPDGKTVHLPAKGKPLSGYEQARIEIAARNAALATQAPAGGGLLETLLANLFGRKAPSEQPSVSEQLQIASATPDAAAASIPQPAQRPRSMTEQTASMEAPKRTINLSSSAADTSFKPILGFDEKAAIKSLFEPRTVFPDTGFSSSALKELSVTHFTGPAIKPAVPRLDRRMLGSQWAQAE